MKLTIESLYALKALIYLAKNAGREAVLLKEITDNCSIPKSFCAKTMQKLAKNNIVRSYRGAKRGFALHREARDLPLKDILEAVEGRDIFDRCIFWSQECNPDSNCPLHDSWSPYKEKIKEWVQTTTLAELAGSEEGKAGGPALGLV